MTIFAKLMRTGSRAASEYAFQTRDNNGASRAKRYTVVAASIFSIFASVPAYAEDKAYPSDNFTGEGFVSMLSGWDAITKNRPDIISENLRKLIEINQDATLSERKHALIDQYEDMAGTMGDALGKRLGEIYSAAYKKGDLPKTKFLLDKEEGRAAGEKASANPSKAHFDFPRPYLVSDRIFRFDYPDGDAYASKSSSFPSGHTSQAYWQGTLLATIVPERFGEILARTAQASHNRLVMGVHYPLDVVGGRMMGQRIAAYRWNDSEFRPLLLEAAQEIRTYLEQQCGASLDVCIAADTPYLSDAEAARQYDYRLTYGFEPMGKTNVEMVVPKGSEDLLLTRFPYLSAEQRAEVLKTTALPSGYPLDIKGDEAGWQRLNLSAAGRGYGAIMGDVKITLDSALADNHTPGSVYNAADLWANDIAGDGTLTKAGTGSLKLTGNNSFGGLTLDGGSVELTAVNAFKGNLQINSGTLTNAGALSAAEIKVAGDGALNVSGTLDAAIVIDGTLSSNGAHLLGQATVSKQGVLELANLATTQPALSVDGEKASLKIDGTLSVSFPKGAKLCPGTSFTAIAASHGGKIGGNVTKLEASHVLAAKSMSYKAEIKDNALVITLDGKPADNCK